MLRNLLLAAAAAAGALTLASSANATTELVSNVGVYDWDTVSSSLGTFVSTGIIFNGTQLVFCVDLEHDIFVTGYVPALSFDLGVLKYTGGGAPVSRAVSNEIGQLADDGLGFLADYGASTISYGTMVDDLDAVQASIWSLEYGTTFTSNAADHVYIDGEIASLLGSVHDTGGGRAISLIAHTRYDRAGVQNMVIGGFGPVPEPASWALMIGGFGLAGAMLRRRRAALA